MLPLRCAVIGDHYVGKSSMLTSFTRNELPPVYSKTTYDVHLAVKMFKSKPYIVYARDISSLTNNRWQSILAFDSIDIVFICFAIDDEKSFHNVRHKYLQMARMYRANLPIFLVGLKSDLRKLQRHQRRRSRRIRSRGQLKRSMQRLVKVSAAEDLVSEEKMAAYVECSAYSQIGLEQLFERAIKIVYNYESTINSCC